jgi:hypothetical protein
MGRFRFVCLIVIPFLMLIPKVAQSQAFEEGKGIYAAAKDSQGNWLEGYLQLYPTEITVSTKDNEEKSVPLQIVESIKVEKLRGIAAADLPGTESYYSVRLQNSQEVFTLKKNYTFSLNTSIGVVTKTIGPETFQESLRKDPSLTSKPENTSPLIRDKSVLLSLEFKF